MNKIITFPLKIFLVLIVLSFYPYKIYGEESESTLTQLEILQQDIKTLEKVVYSQDFKNTDSTLVLSNNENDVLTKHLLKLSELEEQFKMLTNSFEEINFKLDKLSSRISKIQSDNQIRFQDLEGLELGNKKSTKSGKKKKLPGSSEEQELGAVSDSEIASVESMGTVQKTQSIESVGAVITEDADRTEKLLPKTSPEKQYEFAQSFIKVGDYEMAELALREFVDTNPNHELAGNAQFWYGETFRIRQLYSDAATAYLDGYQKYPKSKKAPRNLLELGVMMVQIGEKEQGCSMILNVKKQYPNANQSVIQKAEHEKKKFNCDKKS